jgi:hypothetical protein
MKKRDKIKHFFIGGHNFQSEFRRQMRMIIIITLGFTIAFSWRQTIFDLVQTAVQKFFHLAAAASSVATSTAITILSLVLIYAASHFLKDKKDGF